MQQGNIDNQFLPSKTYKKENQYGLILKKCNSPSTSPFISVNFNLEPIKRQNGPLTSINLVPIFNNDGKYYTPSFILPIQKAKYIENQQTYKMVHQRKVKDMDEQKNQIFVPKPSKTNSYCCICKIAFEDYLTHVNIPKHKQIMKKSIYCKFIKDLTSIFNKNTVYTQDQSQENLKTQRNLLHKKKKISKTVQQTNQTKKPRGRPKKILSKLQSLASIPTTISIQV